MEQSQFAQYLAVLMLLGVAIAAPFGMILVSTLVGKRGKRSQTKDTAYECGMIPVGEAIRESVKFHLVAMLFHPVRHRGRLLYRGRSFTKRC